MSLKSAAILAVQFLLLIALGQAANFLSPPIVDVNLDIVLMLTPYGVVKNLLIVPNQVLASFYFDQLPPAGAILDPGLWLFIILNTIFGSLLLKEIRNSRLSS